MNTEPSWGDDKSPSSSDRSVSTTTQEPSTSNVHERNATGPVEIDAGAHIYSVTFFADGKHAVSGGTDCKIRRWLLEDGMEIGTPMDVGDIVQDIAVSQDGEWLVNGTSGGQVMTWNSQSHEKANEFNAHEDSVNAVDISPDGTKIASGSDDKTIRIWTFSTGEQLLNPFYHDYCVVAVKFSPDGGLLATASTQTRGHSVRIYDVQDSRMLFDVPIRVNSFVNRSLAWLNDGKQLFALSYDGNISCLDASSGTTLSKWRIHSADEPRCIVLAGNGSLIASTANSSVSFWDIKTQLQLGSVVDYPHDIRSLAISPGYDIVTAGDQKLTLRDLREHLPSPYRDDMLREREIRFERGHDHALPQPAPERDECPSGSTSEQKVADRGKTGRKRVHLDNLVRELGHELAECKRAASREKDALNKTIKSLSEELRRTNTAQLRKDDKDFRDRLSRTQDAAKKDKDKLNKVIQSLRKDIRVREDEEQAKVAQFEQKIDELKHQLADSGREIDRLNQIVRFHERTHHCEYLYAHGRIYDATKALLEFVSTVSEDLRVNKSVSDWLAEFGHRCSTMLEKIGDDALNAGDHDEAAKTYITALSLAPSAAILFKWTSMMLVRGSEDDILITAVELKLPKCDVYRALCDALEGEGHVTKAFECFRRMQKDLEEDEDEDERARWENGFRQRCVEKLEKLGDAAIESRDSDAAIASYSMALSLSPSATLLFKWTREMLIGGSEDGALSAAIELEIPESEVCRAICDVLEGDGQVIKAIDCFRRIPKLRGDTRANDERGQWELDFQRRCVEKLRKLGDVGMESNDCDAAITYYSAALSLAPSAALLFKWTKTMLTRASEDGVLSAAAKFNLPANDIHQALCDVLEGNNHVAQAIRFFQQVLREGTGSSGQDKQSQWELDFRRRCIAKLEKLGNAAMESNDHKTAIGHFSAALQLDPMYINDIVISCCMVRASFLEGELDRVNREIERNRSSYQSYKRKHCVLHRMGRYKEAFRAFEMMLSKLKQSPNPNIRKLRDKYVDATPTIRRIVQQAIRHIPRVIINIPTGRLYDKAQQALAFEQLAIFDEFRSSMITLVDEARVRRAVKKFYRYVMLSHRWHPDEPTLQMVENIGSIYALQESSLTMKLLGFCKLVRNLRFQWAWSDTCCINQADKSVQQESVVAMFRWYSGSALTIVHLLGVLSDLQEFGCLWRSIWNTRGWTFQEYVASQVVQFYTEDWKPYLGLTVYNHKESPVILSEMEQAMSLSTQRLVTLQPGLDRAREKLYLASRRHTTREEDIAYSLFGIFNVALPVIYGEGNQAVGRLLEHVLTRSDNITLLAWTGVSGSHHSYLPADLTVYDQITPPHVPQPIETTEMDTMVTLLPLPSADPLQSVALYERLCDLPPLSLVAGRLRLPGIVFPLTSLVSLPDADSDLPVYQATTPLLGDVEIETADNLDRTEGLLLIHPWISPLLDNDFSFGVPQFDIATRALRLVVRLRQSFGALLLAPLARAQYRRVATDSLIMVRVREETSLAELTQAIRTVDIQ